MTSTYWLPDLDLRPAESERRTTPARAQECPYCGYVNCTIADPPPKGVDRHWLQSDAYRSCEHTPLTDELAQKFYRCYMIRRKAGDGEQALKAVLRAAWMCDDAEDTDGAIACRLIAAEYVKTLPCDKEEAALLRAELLRRAKRFEAAIEAAKSVALSANREWLSALLGFERNHAAQRDSRTYTVEEALREMQYRDISPHIVITQISPY